MSETPLSSPEPFQDSWEFPGWEKPSALRDPQLKASVEFHVSEWFQIGKHPRLKSILPEVEKLTGLNVRCIYGDEEKEILCKIFNLQKVKWIGPPGRHHFGGNYRAIAEKIMKHLPP